MTVRRLAAKDCLQSCGLTSKGLSLCLFELNYRLWVFAIASSTPGYEGERSGPNHWTDMTQGTRDESCGHIRKWTSGLWARVQLQGCEAERQKLGIFSQCENILLRSLSFAQFIRLSWITSDEKKVNKPLRLSQSTKLSNRQKINIYVNSHIC